MPLKYVISMLLNSGTRKTISSFQCVILDLNAADFNADSGELSFISAT